MVIVEKNQTFAPFVLLHSTLLSVFNLFTICGLSYFMDLVTFNKHFHCFVSLISLLTDTLLVSLKHGEVRTKILPIFYTFKNMYVAPIIC